MDPPLVIAGGLRRRTQTVGVASSGVLRVVLDLVGVLGVDSALAQVLVGPGKQRKPPLIRTVQIPADGAEAQSWRGI